MNLTAGQVRQARALLGWSSPRLARTAKVGFDKVIRAQDDEGIRTLSGLDVAAIRAALERAGVRFAADDEKRPSAVLTGART